MKHLLKSMARNVLGASEEPVPEIPPVPEPELRLEARHIESPTPPARAWLSTHLEDDEDLLAWLPADSKILLAEQPEASLHFMLTSRRASLVILSPPGDSEQRALPEEPLTVEDPSDGWLPLSRQDVRSGDFAWEVTWGNASLYKELAPIVGLPLAAKLLELARWNWKKGDEAHALSLLAKAMKAGERHAPVIRNLRPLAGDESFPDLGSALSVLVAEQPDSTRLARLCEDWELDFEQRSELLEQILALDEPSLGWAAPLYRSVHGQALEQEKNDQKKTEWNLDFADYLISNNLVGEAVEILEKWLDAHQSFDARQILPSSSGREPSPALASRRWALELLEQARVRAGDSNEDILPRLAQLQPLDKEFLAQLGERAKGHAKELLSTVGALHAAGGLEAEDSKTPEHGALGALEPQQIDEVLQHPEAREGSTWGTLQGMLASARAPDSNALRNFCERLEAGADLQMAAADASFVLGTAVPEIFISRGDQAIGLRAFESKPPFILIGSQHLDAESPMYLRPLEMRFGIAAELAHLRYGHTRATAAEVREGALDKSLAALGFAVSLLPFAASASKLAAGSQVAGNLTSALEKVPMGALEIISESAGAVRGLAGKPKDAFLSMANDDIVEAHRVMQLTADRAGLLLCGDLRSAIRFMFLASSGYHLEIPLLERRGLHAVLEKRDASGALLYEDLMIRIGALLAFHLSEDHPLLRQAAGF